MATHAGSGRRNWTPNPSALFSAGRTNIPRFFTGVVPGTDTQELYNRYASIHDAPLPFFVPVSEEQVLFSIAPTQFQPYELLLRRMREAHSPDYFKSVDQREGVFRKQLHQLLPMKRVHFADKPIRLRVNGRVVTDIDATVLVDQTGTLGLFQLKWQDPFGGDLRERRNRQTNLVPAANTWVTNVLDWIGRESADSISKLAGFGRGAPKVREVILFVLGRYHCNFSFSDSDPRAVWCTWPQFIRAVDKIGIVEDPFVELKAELLRKEVPKQPEPNKDFDGIRLRDFDIEIA